MGARLTYADGSGVRVELHLNPADLPTVRASMLTLVARLLGAEDLVVAGGVAGPPAGRRRLAAPAAAPGGGDSPGAGDQPERESRSYPCGQCDRTFASSQAVALHRTRTHRPASAPVAATLTFPCPEDGCGRVYDDSNRLAHHRRVTHDPPAPVRHEVQTGMTGQAVKVG